MDKYVDTWINIQMPELIFGHTDIGVGCPDIGSGSRYWLKWLVTGPDIVILVRLQDTGQGVPVLVQLSGYY